MISLLEEILHLLVREVARELLFYPTFSVLWEYSDCTSCLPSPTDTLIC